MSFSNLPAQRVRAKSEPEPSLPPSELHVSKRRKTITMPDSSDHEKNATDQYHVNVELADAPVTHMSEPPPLISDHTQVTPKFVDHAIAYAKFRLPRDVTPRTATLLKALLELAEKVKARHDLVDKICLYQCTRTLHSESFLSRRPTKEELEQREAFRELSILRYYLQYGDYVGDECNEFRHQAAKVAGKSEYFFSDKKPWTEMQELIDNENTARSQWHAGDQKGPIPPQPTQDAIYKACVAGNLDYYLVLYSIRWYAQRCSRAHNGVGHMIKECQWEELGARLHWDLRCIPLLFGAEEQDMMTKVLENLARRYFFELRMEGSILNKYAIRLATQRQQDRLEQASKARDKKGKGITGPITIDQQRLAEQDQ